MTAAEIAEALGDARHEGRAWRCRCPLHGGRSLIVRDGDGGCILVTCWAGCDRLDVLAELRRRGLLDGHEDFAPRIVLPPRRDDDAWRTARALTIWHQARPATGTIVETYLRSRGISPGVLPETLRFHPECCRPRDDQGNFLPPLPAMVALVEHAQRGPVAVHVTYLRPDGSAKADIPKKNQKASFGPIGGGAIRLSAVEPDSWVAIGEGIETTLSVMQACSLPGWAALSAAGIERLVSRPEVAMVLICADNDANGVGERAARTAAERFLREGRKVRIAMPPEPGADFNDVLTGRTVAKIKQVRHVA
jgi:putative DNA primase/helicase